MVKWHVFSGNTSYDMTLQVKTEKRETRGLFKSDGESQIKSITGMRAHVEFLGF